MSLLLFCIGLNHVSQLITEGGSSYRFRSGVTVSYHLHMDDIKLHPRSDRNINSLIYLTRIYNKNIRIWFGLDKCGRRVAKRGEVIQTEWVELPEGRIADIQDIYKYMGIPKANGSNDKDAQRLATAKYLQKVRQALRSQQKPSHQYIHPTSHQILSWNLATGGDGCHLSEDTKASHNTERSPPKVQPEAIQKEGRRGLVSVSIHE